MEIKLIEKYLQRYLDDVLTPKINSELGGEDNEPIKLSVYKVTYGESNPNRFETTFSILAPNFFLSQKILAVLEYHNYIPLPICK